MSYSNLHEVFFHACVKGRVQHFLCQLNWISAQSKVFQRGAKGEMVDLINIFYGVAVYRGGCLVSEDAISKTRGDRAHTLQDLILPDVRVDLNQ